MLGFLVVMGLIFIALGLRALLNPLDAAATPFDIQINGVDGYNQMRASAGGVTAVSGAVMLATPWVPQLVAPSLVLLLVLLGGLTVGRLYSLVVDGRPGVAVWVAWALEGVGLAQAVFWSLMQFA